jgi:2-polyprenyl-6-methoxyphenol hydroxylase-like FAD-dependent oxidoreductase
MRLQTDVIIVGAGPTGLTLALELGRRGVRCALVERNQKPSGLPKMERCNARTLEIYRRMGLAEKVRAAGFPRTAPMDIFLVTSLAEPPLLRFPYPSVADYEALIASVNDGSQPREPYQLISQYTLEPLLKAEAEKNPLIDVRFGHEAKKFAQDDDGVTLVCENDRGPMEVRGRWLVGCDGAGSLVRRELGVTLEGDANLLELRQALFRAPDLYERIVTGKGRHYHFPDSQSTFVIVQDDTKHFTLHTVVDSDEAAKAKFERVVGMKIDYETLYIGKWKQNLLVAPRFMDRRVFIAGDAAHLVIPTGGLGMNTGVGEATDLAWKFEAMVKGWGGPKLLPSYQIERQPVGARNVAASKFATLGRRVWRAACGPAVFETTPEGLAARERLVALAEVEQRKSAEMIGAELGYRYLGSPLVCAEAGDPPADDFVQYRPTAWPGSRLPHVWLSPGVSILDRLGDGYTLVDLTAQGADARGLAAAFAAFGAPFGTLRAPSAAARAVYERDLVLVRPDLHVVWRGNAPPADAGRIAAVATGHAW